MKKGFSLIETLVAITVLMIAVVAPMSLSQRSLQAAQLAKDQTIASYLAQDGMEYIVYLRDTNERSGNGWLDGLSDCIDQECIVDTVNDSVTACGGVCSKMRFDETGGFYGYDGSWEQVEFTRSVEITTLSATEVKVRVDVEWKTGAFASRTITIRQNLFDWQ